MEDAVLSILLYEEALTSYVGEYLIECVVGNRVYS